MTFVTPAPALAAFAPTAPSLWERLGHLRAAMAQRAAQRQLYRRTLAELDALSDRDLSDLGLARGDVGRVAREAAALARSGPRPCPSARARSKAGPMGSALFVREG